MQSIETVLFQPSAISSYLSLKRVHIFREKQGNNLKLGLYIGLKRSKKRYQQFSLDMCYPVPTLFQVVLPVQGHHGCVRLEYCIDGHFGAPFQPLWPPGTAIPGPKIFTTSSAWICAFPFQHCSKLCHPFRVAMAA